MNIKHTNKKLRAAHASDETWAEVNRIGNGNNALGLRIAVHSHARLVEALRDAYLADPETPGAKELLDQIEAMK